MKRLVSVASVFLLLTACSSHNTKSAEIKPTKAEKRQQVTLTGDLKEDAQKYYVMVNSAYATSKMYDEKYVKAFQKRYENDASLTQDQSDLVLALSRMSSFAKLVAAGADKDSKYNLYDKARKEAEKLLSSK